MTWVAVGSPVSGDADWVARVVLRELGDDVLHAVGGVDHRLHLVGDAGVVTVDVTSPEAALCCFRLTVTPAADR